MLCCILLTAVLTEQHNEQYRDNVLLNDIVQTVKAHMDAPEEAVSRFDTEMLIFGNDGQLLCASKNAPEDIRSQQDAIREGWLSMAVTDSGNCLGFAAVPDPLLQT